MENSPNNKAIHYWRFKRIYTFLRPPNLDIASISVVLDLVFTSNMSSKDGNSLEKLGLQAFFDAMRFYIPHLRAKQKRIEVLTSLVNS